MRPFFTLILTLLLTFSATAQEEGYVFAGTVTRMGEKSVTVDGVDTSGDSKTLRFRISDVTQMPLRGAPKEGDRIVVRFERVRAHNNATTIRLLKRRDRTPEARLPEPEPES
jgi:ribosomal protein S1